MRSGKDGSMVVRKHNELIEAKYKLTLNNTSDRFKKDLQEISSLIENVISTKHT